MTDDLLDNGCLRTNRRPVWEAKAGENIDEWGEQSLETLLLAAGEEYGELAQALLEHRAEDARFGRLYDELDDLGALLIQIEQRLDATLEGGQQEGGRR